MPTCDRCGKDYPFLHCEAWISDQDYLCDYCVEEINGYDEDLDFEDWDD